MKYYKHTDGRVFSFESDGSQDHLIKEGMVKMTPQQIEEHTAPTTVEPQSIPSETALKSPSGTPFKIKVADDRTISTEEIADA